MKTMGFEKLNACFREHGVIKAAIFGSHARNDAKRNSDLDFIVSFAGKYDLLDMVELKQDLENLMQKHVDLITYDALADDDFCKNVLREARIIYEQN
jgi:predicted nucleotidyltransferase